jgi:glutathione S-transferase
VILGSSRRASSRAVPRIPRACALVTGDNEAAGDFVTDDVFTLADIVLGLSVHRWFMTPMERPELPAVAAYYDRLATRPGYRLHGRNGTP